MNSQQRRKLRRQYTCRNCKHSAYHCPGSGCNYYTKEEGWCPAECEEFEPLSMKYKKTKKYSKVLSRSHRP